MNSNKKIIQAKFCVNLKKYFKGAKTVNSFYCQTKTNSFFIKQKKYNFVLLSLTARTQLKFV